MREQQEFICPDVEPGDLVITEIRGPQAGEDDRGQWFEVFNARSEAVDLRALQADLLALSGAGLRITVRAPELVVDAGGFVVLGHHMADDPKDYVDYSFFDDYFTDGEKAADPKKLRSFESSGIIELLACDESIDRLVYRNLPQQGTLSFDGSVTPTAERNDDPLLFCTDAVPGRLEPSEPPPEKGIPGTPGEGNRPCA